MTDGRQVALLAEVKFAERQLEKAEAKLGPAEERIKDALRAGKREAAQELALRFEVLKDEVAKAKQKVARAQQALAKAKAQSAELSDALVRNERADRLAGVADLLSAVSKDDDILQRVQRDNAIAEARAELAMENAPLDEPPLSSAEDILKEFE